MYDPTVGKWLSEDPIGFEASDANLSRYVGNAPTTYIDPDGLSKYGVIPGNTAVWVQESDGTIHTGTTGQDLEDIVNGIHERGGKMSRCIVKGHGSDIGVSEHPEKDPMISVTSSEEFVNLGLQGKSGAISIDNPGNDATDKLKEITGPGTRIELRGCSTGPAAKKMSEILPGVTVVGTPWPVAGIPATTFIIGPPSNEYRGGKHIMPRIPKVCCFKGDTRVITQSGSREIDKLQVGDVVSYWDEAEHIVKPTRIVRLDIHEGEFDMYCLRTPASDEVHVTSGHYFLTMDGWRASESMHDVTEVVGIRDLAVPTQAIHRYRSKHAVHNILTESGDYLVGEAGLATSGLTANTCVDSPAVKPLVILQQHQLASRTRSVGSLSITPPQLHEVAG